MTDEGSYPVGSRQAAQLWAQMKLSDREHVRDFLESEGRTVTDEEVDAWRSGIREMIDSRGDCAQPRMERRGTRAVRDGR
jgi:plasmid stabilization system protein ParE